MDTILWMTIDGKFFEITTYIVMFGYFILIKRHLKKKVCSRKSRAVKGRKAGRKIGPVT